jgi:uncharacterized protein (DUF885 family)
VKRAIERARLGQRIAACRFDTEVDFTNPVGDRLDVAPMFPGGWTFPQLFGNERRDPPAIEALQRFDDLAESRWRHGLQSTCGLQKAAEVPGDFVEIVNEAGGDSSPRYYSAMTTTRRDFVLASGAALAATRLPAQSVLSDHDAAAERLLAGFTEEMLVDYPESATSLGIDTGERAVLKSKLSDRSAAGQRTIAERAARRLDQLKAIDTAALGPAARIDVDVMRTAHEFTLEGFAFPYGDVALLNSNWSYRNAPYVVAQNTGAFLEIPSLLDEQHTVTSAEDAEAYLARLEAYAGQIDGETERLKSAAAQNVIAPNFLLDKTLGQLRLARAGNVADWSIVTSLAKRTDKMPGDFAARAAKIAADKVAPALGRQFEELLSHRRRATSEAGVWKLSQGDEYYAWALRAGTTTRMTPDQIHRQGEEELRELQSRMDGILRQQGMTRGTVGERMTALGKDPRFAFAENDEGRARLMAFLNARVADMRTRLPRAFDTLVPGYFEIKRMAPEVEPGAPGAYGGPGSIDGKSAASSGSTCST